MISFKKLFYQGIILHLFGKQELISRNLISKYIVNKYNI